MTRAGRGIRAAGKRLFEEVALRAVAPLLRRAPGTGLILAYHNVVPDELAGCGDASLHLPFSRFRAQVRAIAARCEVVDLPALFDAPARTSRPRIAITFDDAYRGAVALGLAELQRVGLPATVFVAPALLGAGPPWWDRVAAARPGAWTDAARDRALDELRGDAAAILAELGLPPDAGRLPDPCHIADEAELLAAVHRGGVTLASHTWSHRNVATLAAAELQAEYRRPLEWLRERVGDPLPWLAYPYGRTSATAARAAREAGYIAAVCVEGGWLPAEGANPLALPRFNVPAGLSTAGFELRLRGLLAGSPVPLDDDPDGR